MIGDIQVSQIYIKKKRKNFLCFSDFLKEFLDGNYLNSRRNDLLTDDRLRVYVRVTLVDEKETITGNIFHPSHHYHHHHHASPIMPPPLPQHPLHQQQTIPIPKNQASTSSSIASSSSATPITTMNLSYASSTTSTINSGLFNNDKERFKSLELLSNQIKILLDDERFTDVRIHVIPKQQQDEHRKSNRLKRAFIKHEQYPSCSSCHCTSEKMKTILTNNEQISDHHHEQLSSGKVKGNSS